MNVPDYRPEREVFYSKLRNASSDLVTMAVNCDSGELSSLLGHLGLFGNGMNLNTRDCEVITNTIVNNTAFDDKRSEGDVRKARRAVIQVFAELAEARDDQAMRDWVSGHRAGTRRL